MGADDQMYQTLVKMVQALNASGEYKRANETLQLVRTMEENLNVKLQQAIFLSLQIYSRCIQFGLQLHPYLAIQ